MSIKADSIKRERTLAKRYGTRPHKQSGGGTVKGDLTVGQFKCDVKSTTRKQITITREMLEKIDGEAFDAGKNPALILDFGNDFVWWVVPERVIEI